MISTSLMGDDVAKRLEQSLKKIKSELPYSERADKSNRMSQSLELDSGETEMSDCMSWPLNFCLLDG
ncbi:hypothetical protein Plhal304r1_c044g0125031 [Plasmopara halstedii]